MASSDSTEPVFPGFLFNNEVLLKGGEGVKDLRVLHDTHNRSFTSRWKLTKEEIQAIIETGDIYLTILGAAHPAVSLRAGRPVGTEQGVVVMPAEIKDGQYMDVQELYRIAELSPPSSCNLSEKESDASGEK